jgi:outer membrane biosynthesis protein TonB
MQTRRLHQLGQRANENHREEASGDPLWVVDVGDGQMRVVQGHRALKELIVSHGLPSNARVYELSAVPKTLREIPEVAAAFEAAVQAKELAPAEAETKAQPEREPEPKAEREPEREPEPEPEPEPRRSRAGAQSPRQWARRRPRPGGAAAARWCPCRSSI